METLALHASQTKTKKLAGSQRLAVCVALTATSRPWLRGACDIRFVATAALALVRPPPPTLTLTLCSLRLGGARCLSYQPRDRS